MLRSVFVFSEVALATVFQDVLFYFLVLGFDKVPLWGIFLISAGSAVLCALFVWFFICPRMKKKIERK